MSDKIPKADATWYLGKWFFYLDPPNQIAILKPNKELTMIYQFFEEKDGMDPVVIEKKHHGNYSIEGSKIKVKWNQEKIESTIQFFYKDGQRTLKIDKHIIDPANHQPKRFI